MAHIYLRHPLHGEKVAHSDNEASSDRANGWVDFDPIAKPIEVEQVTPEPVKAAKPKPVKGDPADVIDFFKVTPKP